MTTAHAMGLLALYVVFHLILGAIIYVRTRGVRVIRCSVTGAQAAVELDAVRAAVRLTRPEDVTVLRCSLWPERRQCFQWCRDEMERTALQGSLRRPAAKR